MNAPNRQTSFVPFDNSYARLPERFYARLPPTPVSAPKLLKLNDGLAEQLVLDPAQLRSPEGVAMLAGNRVPEGAEPLAMAYAGHQFGGWVPQLGDGRAILLGEVIDRDGRRRDIQLKGAGPTPFSRMGDGRAGIGPVLREYIVSEAMAALGIPTTRSLAAVATGEAIFREQALPGAILTRVATSHIRVGTFQYFAARDDVEGLRLLADHVIARHYPELRDAKQPYRALIEAVAARQAALVARWQCVGFIHGVMNTDNMSIAGETIDYGPCAFMDTYHPETVFSSIDRMGRYAYVNQPRIAHWNIAVLAQSLFPLLADDDDAALVEARAAIEGFPAAFEAAWLDGMRRKLGLATEAAGDAELVQSLLEAMASNQADFTLTFRALSSLGNVVGADDDAVRRLFEDPSAFDRWAVDWRQRLAAETVSESDRQAAMRSVNPAYIPRNHRVEEAIAAAHDGFMQPFEDLVTVLSDPYREQDGFAAYADPPKPDEVVQQTFCGT